jgi:archaellum component FlaC
MNPNQILTIETDLQFVRITNGLNGNSNESVRFTNKFERISNKFERISNKFERISNEFEIIAYEFEWIANDINRSSIEF